MAKPPACRFIMSNGTARRCVMSVFESAKQDVYINLRANGLVRSLGEPIARDEDDNPTGLRIVNHKVSIHPSRQSETNVNVLKLIQTREDGSEVVRFQHTAALKQDDGFALVYARRLTGLESPEYDLARDEGQAVYMGAFDSRFFTPYMAVFAGPKNRHFARPGTWPFQVYQQVFTDVRLVVLLAFFTTSAHESSHVQVGGTTPEGGPSPGMNEQECSNLFRDLALQQRDELAVTIHNLIGEPYGQVVSLAELVKVPDRGSREYQMWTVAIRNIELNFANSPQAQSENAPEEQV